MQSDGVFPADVPSPGSARHRARAWHGAALTAMILASTPLAVASEGPPSRPGIDAPELARLGPYSVGVRTVELVARDAPDVLSYDPRSRHMPAADRRLTIDLWYPAEGVKGPGETYAGALDGEAAGQLEHFVVPGIAVRNARAQGGRHPLVLVSHGLSNVTAALTWLTENLASKGYVVAAIRHEDPPYRSAAGKLPALVLRRPLDIVFAAGRLRAVLGSEGLIDPAALALIGYSVGGCGVLTAAGATLDPSSPLAQLPEGSMLEPYARGGAKRAAVLLDVKAVVALAPAGGGKTQVWGEQGLADIHTPLLLIAGDHDTTVDYASNARAFFREAAGASRYLLTYRMAGHAIGLNPAPESMRHRLWDLDWFEDPVWRKDRIIGVNLHFITAFLDRYLRGDESRAAYLDVAVSESSDGQWPAQQPADYQAYSTQTGGVTVWKGFQLHHAAGLELLHLPAGGKSASVAH